jgi:hypothetical protein
VRTLVSLLKHLLHRKKRGQSLKTIYLTHLSHKSQLF